MSADRGLPSLLDREAPGVGQVQPEIPRQLLRRRLRAAAEDVFDALEERLQADARIKVDSKQRGFWRVVI
jgi:hypothetical protein